MKQRPQPREFGQWLAGLREEAGLTQEDAALRIGISRPQLARWETGRSTPTIESMDAIAAAFGIDQSIVLKNLGYEIENWGSLSSWSLSPAKRIERRAVSMTPERKRALERAIDSMLAAT